jgi:hypothetical protein
LEAGGSTCCTAAEGGTAAEPVPPFISEVWLQPFNANAMIHEATIPNCLLLVKFINSLPSTITDGDEANKVTDGYFYNNYPLEFKVPFD